MWNAVPAGSFSLGTARPLGTIECNFEGARAEAGEHAVQAADARAGAHDSEQVE